MRAVERRTGFLSLQLIGLGALVVAVLIAVLAELKAQPAPNDNALVSAAVARLGKSFRAGDKSAARKLLSLQFSFVDENGKRHSRKEFLAGFKKLAPRTPADAKISLYGSVATVTGHRVSASGKDVFFLAIWTKTKGAWRILAVQDAILGPAVASADPPPAALSQARHLRSELTKILDCKNPCTTIPYRVRSAAEQDVIVAYQAVEKAMVAHDATEYGKYLTDEYMYYRSGFPPVTKEGRIAHVEDEKAQHLPAVMTAVQSMRLGVYGDSAVMISTHGIPDGTEPPRRISRVWVKRNGRWQLVISMQTDVEPPASEQ